MATQSHGSSGVRARRHQVTLGITRAGTGWDEDADEDSQGWGQVMSCHLSVNVHVLGGSRRANTRVQLPQHFPTLSHGSLRPSTSQSRSDFSNLRNIVQRMAKQIPCSNGPSSQGLSGHRSYCKPSHSDAIRQQAAGSRQQARSMLTHSFVVTPLHTRQQWHAASTSMKRLNRQP